MFPEDRAGGRGSQRRYDLALKKVAAVEALFFARFDAALRENSFQAMSGQIVNATLVAAPE